MTLAHPAWESLPPSGLSVSAFESRLCSGLS